MIEVPGYHILRQIGQGGMASVYLAIQLSVDREVALKVMNPHLLADPNFGERFLREARIAAKLQHQHVVGVYDVSKFGNLHYIAMEYLSGGSISGQNPQYDLLFALRIMREIATALDYAHRKGFVHRDIKPDNILLRENGMCVLTDFGIARACDSATRMTLTGAVIGTPYYMSPEQARGQAIDGRADLYSLGVVLYELLVGAVPFQAENSLAVGIKHISEAPPPLPAHLRKLQPLLDCLLAKSPEDRYQSGGELAKTVREYELAIGNMQMPELYVPNARQREALLGLEPPVEMQHRSTIRLWAKKSPKNAVQEAESAKALPAAPKRGLNYAWATVLLLALLGGFAWIRQDWLRGLIPNTELNALLSKADLAARQGRLVPPQPDDALTLYRQVLETDADNNAAAIGIRNIGQALLERSRQALAAQDLQAARARFAEAKQILQGGEALNALERQIQSAENKLVDATGVLEKALMAKNERLLVGENGAAAYFAQVLALDPGNGVALKGLRDVSEVLSLEAEKAIAENDLVGAEQNIATIEKIQGDYPPLIELKAALGQAKARSMEEQNRLWRVFEAHLSQDRLLEPAGGAVAALRALATRDPDNPAISAAKEKLSRQLLVRFDAYLENKQVGRAEAFLQAAREFSSPGQMAGAKKRLQAHRDAPMAPVVPSAIQQEAINAYLSKAETALQDGKLNEPPGENAFDLYRAALVLDRDNEKARSGLAAIPQKARELFEQSLGAKRLNAAAIYLDAFRDSSDDSGAKKQMAASLAQAFVQKADQEISSAQYAAAEKSVERARALSPNEPSIAATSAKLQQARGQ